MKGKRAVLVEHQSRPITILNASGVNLAPKDQSKGVDDDVAFATFDLLTRIKLHHFTSVRVSFG